MDDREKPAKSGDSVDRLCEMLSDGKEKQKVLKVRFDFV